VLGELRVSKFLLDHFAAQPVRSFRPGHLRNPYTLPQVLLATGYPFSSSVTANNSLSHLPFQLNYNRENKSELEVFEFPVTIEDEQAPKLGERVAPAVALARRIARYHGICVVLIHTDVLEHKLEFEKQFVEAVRDFSWFGSIADLGAWWKARNGIELDVMPSADGRYGVALALPEKIAGLTLELPASWKLVGTAPANLDARQSGDRVILNSEAGKLQLWFTAR
jgi:hypothetical protein